MAIPSEWIAALGGGALIGLASAFVLGCHGSLLGVSGFVGGLLEPWEKEDRWRAAFLAGLLAGGAFWKFLGFSVFEMRILRPFPMLVIAGLLVGFGARLANGCTSGHGVCGCSRLSPRSLAATGVFMAAGAASVYFL